MRVVIDISPLQSAHKHRGVGSYTRHLVEALRQLDDKNSYIMTSRPDHERADVIHYPYFDLFFLTLPPNHNQKVVVTIHDVIPLVYPTAYRPGLRGRIKFWLQSRRLSQVSAVITDSERSKRDIIRLLHVPPNKVHRVYLAAAGEIQRPSQSTIEKVLKKYQLRHPYWLYVGDINYNKNISGLLRAFTGVPQPTRLVLVSRALQKNIPESQEIKKFIHTHQLDDRVLILTTVPLEPVEELNSLYSGADWYVQPSFYEGFGFPVLEAMQCGVPVLCSNGGSLPELAGDAAVMFDPNNAGEMKEVFFKAAKLQDERKKLLIDKGYKRTQQFSWEQTARATADIYQKVMI